MGVLIEHYKGNLPFWLAPIQVKVLTITDEQKDYAKQIFETLLDHDFRTEIDQSSDPIAGQIKTAQLEKIPVMVVVGKKEVANKTVTIRHRDGTQEAGIPIETLLAKLKELNK